MPPRPGRLERPPERITVKAARAAIKIIGSPAPGRGYRPPGKNDAEPRIPAIRLKRERAAAYLRAPRGGKARQSQAQAGEYGRSFFFRAN